MASGNQNMGGWKPYHEVCDSNAPNRPGVYEVCWAGDDKARYIGKATDLQGRLYGHPYHDSEVGNFIGIHMNSNIRPPMVRFQPTSTPQAARQEECRRIREFERKYGEKPKYNQNY